MEGKSESIVTGERPEPALADVCAKLESSPTQPGPNDSATQPRSLKRKLNTVVSTTATAMTSVFSIFRPTTPTAFIFDPSSPASTEFATTSASTTAFSFSSESQTSVVTNSTAGPSSANSAAGPSRPTSSAGPPDPDSSESESECSACGCTSTSESSCSECECDSNSDNENEVANYSASSVLNQANDDEVPDYDEDPLFGVSGHPIGSEQDIAFRAAASSNANILPGSESYHLYQAGQMLRALDLENKPSTVENETASPDIEMSEPTAEGSSAAAATGRKIKLESQDGDVIEADLEMMMKSETIRSMVENLGDDGGNDEEKTTLIPLPTISTEVLTKVVSWATHHKDDPPVDPAKYKNIKAKRYYNISNWDREFFRGLDLRVLNGLMLAANYLDIKELLHLTCKVVAELVNGMNEEEVRDAFDLDNDLSGVDMEQLYAEDFYM